MHAHDQNVMLHPGYPDSPCPAFQLQTRDAALTQAVEESVLERERDGTCTKCDPGREVQCVFDVKRFYLSS